MSETVPMDEFEQIEVEAANESNLPSCESCRKRKLKCSRQRPQCANCERLDTHCIYDPKRNKPGMKSGAVEGLNRRLEAVEQALFNRDDGRAHDSPYVPTPAQNQPQISNSARDHTMGPIVDVLGVLTQEIRKLTSTISQKSERDLSQGDKRDRTWTDSPRPGKRRRAENTSPTSFSDLSDLGSHIVGHSQDFMHSLPDESILELLLDCYFQRVQPWIPILHQANFRKRLATPEGPRSLSVILHAINVSALRFVHRDGQPLPSEEIETQTQRSRQIIMLTALDRLSVENLQALIILAFTDICNGESHRAWPTIGSLSRSVEYLQLSVEREGRQTRPSLIRPIPTLEDPRNWVEEEERRRVFWNVFMLDRFCSVTTGWNTSLTAADVCRRLPVCGGLWYKNTPASTPYFGIWDRSAAKMGNSITFLPAHYPSPTQSSNTEVIDPEIPASQKTHSPTMDMANVGALAYNIESIESLSRITTYFLHQSVDFSNRKEVSSWLTRFKELDLRLVHWKMFLPQQWQDSGESRDIMPGVMDPNMTAAHATHNISMILLHQRIAYPGPELAHIKLPTFCSAETCLGAAMETANITQKYLHKTSRGNFVSPQLAFAAFVSGRALLVHWRFYRTPLVNEFWVLVRNLEEMSRRWVGTGGTQSLFSQFALRLNRLYQRCIQDLDFKIDISGSSDIEVLSPRSCSAGTPRQNTDGPGVTLAQGSGLNNIATEGDSSRALPHTQGSVINPETEIGLENWNHPSTDSEGDELSAISQILMGQGFMDMDRVISFDDMMFTSRSAEVGSAPLNSEWVNPSQPLPEWPR